MAEVGEALVRSEVEVGEPEDAGGMEEYLYKDPAPVELDNSPGRTFKIDKNLIIINQQGLVKGFSPIGNSLEDQIINSMHYSGKRKGAIVTRFEFRRPNFTFFK